MHENILDSIEKPTATNRDFAWFVAKWSLPIIFLLFCTDCISAMLYQTIEHLATYIIIYIAWNILVFVILKAAARDLAYPFEQKPFILLFLLFSIFIFATFIVATGFFMIMMYNILSSSLIPNDFVAQNTSVYAVFSLFLGVLIKTILELLLTLPLFYFFYKKLKKAQAE
jgi:hypothetical protein